MIKKETVKTGLTNTKKAVLYPRFNAWTIIILIVAILFFIISNTGWFETLPELFKVLGYIALILSVLFAGSPLGSISMFVHGFVKVMMNTDSMDNKIIQVQNLVVALCQQLGIYYEKERESALAELTKEDPNQV